MASEFLSEVKQGMRLRGYALKTEKSYLYWITYFIRFHKFRHPSEMGAKEVETFLSYLANQKCVAIGTQKLALNALAYLYNQHLNKPLGDLGFHHAKSPRKIPSVLTPMEVSNSLRRVMVSFTRFFLCYMDQDCGLTRGLGYG